MITDKYIKVVTNQGEFTIELTAKQVEETVRRRMRALMPNARILDIHEVLPDAQQPDLLTKKHK